MLASTEDDCVRLWNPVTGAVQMRLGGPVAHALATVPTPDGTILLAGAGTDHTVRIWNPATGDVLHELEGHTDNIHALAALPPSDGVALLASGSGHGEIIIWELPSQAPPARAGSTSR
ncbi:hypothetical protein GCM10027569_61300 [Flindersiella endophytica]